MICKFCHNNLLRHYDSNHSDGDNYDSDEGAEEDKNEEECFLCGDQSTCILQEQVKLPENLSLKFSCK